MAEKVAEFHKANEMSSVIVVVDRFTKYAVFVPTPATCLAEKVAKLFLKYVVKHFGMPRDIVIN